MLHLDIILINNPIALWSQMKGKNEKAFNDLGSGFVVERKGKLIFPG